MLARVFVVLNIFVLLQNTMYLAENGILGKVLQVCENRFVKLIRTNRMTRVTNLLRSVGCP